MAHWLEMPVDPMKHEPTPFSTVLKCELCGLGSLSPLPQPDEIAALYDFPDYYTHRGSKVASRGSIPERLLSKLAHAADKSEPFDVATIAQSLKPHARICDLGCGHATYLRKFSELGFEVIGVDPDPAAREQAAKAGVMVLDGTAEKLPELHGQFDLVILSHSLEHCRNPKLALENARSILSDNGLCYVEVPNCASEHFQTFTICSGMFDAPRHLHFFTPDCLAELAERSGFQVEKRTFVFYGRDFLPGWREREVEIAQMVPDLNPKRHTFGAAVSLFARSFWKARERKYDSFGMWLRSS
jgi:SAM-dependent methyltransferase